MSLFPVHLARRARRALRPLALPALIVAVGTQGGGVYKAMNNVSTPYVNRVRPADVAAMKTVVRRVDSLLRRDGAPAYCCHDSRAHPIGLTSASEPGTYPVVRLNPAYFDGSAGATAVRLIVVGSEQAYAAEMRVKPTEPNYQLMKAIREQLDWSALAAMVK